MFMAPVATRTRGYEIMRAAVPPSAVDRTLRHLHLDLVRNGASAETIGRWLWSAHWFPHLKWDAEVVGLLDSLPAELREGELCDPQILLQPPDTDEDIALTPHTDELPEWADGRPYIRIVGVALTPNRRTNGGLLVWPLDGGEPEAVELEAGDVVVMDPALPHTSGLNREGAMRYAAYFRFLTPA
jgi:ectoine hydroxylase-related dioxygenase (phytanoyl-CoA dioxygenase family)